MATPTYACCCLSTKNIPSNAIAELVKMAFLIIIQMAYIGGLLWRDAQLVKMLKN